MRPPETFPHGTTLHSVHGGFRIRRPDRFSYGRIFVHAKRYYHATEWRATCDAWNGYTWLRDQVMRRPTIAELEQAVRDYVARLDHHAYVASGDCHA